MPQIDLGPGRHGYYERVGFNPYWQRPIYIYKELINKYLQSILLIYEALYQDYSYQQDLGAMFSKDVPNRIKTLKEAQASVGHFDYLIKDCPELEMFITEILPFLSFNFTEKDVMSFSTLELPDCALRMIELGKRNADILRLVKKLPEGIFEE